MNNNNYVYIKFTKVGLQMSCVTKHIYGSEIRDIFRMWNNHLKSIQNILPKDYTNQDIINILKKYYPHE